MAKVVARSVEHLDSVIAQLARDDTVTASAILRSQVSGLRGILPLMAKRPPRPRDAMQLAA